jgi:hypothetical protein
VGLFGPDHCLRRSGCARRPKEECRIARHQVVPTILLVVIERKYRVESQIILITCSSSDHDR